MTGFGMRIRALGVAMIAALASATYASGAPSDNGPGPPTMLMTGQSADGAFLGGRFAPAAIIVDPSGHLMATGTANGTLTGPPGSTQSRFQQPLSVPLDRASSQASCQMTDLVFGPVDTTMDGRSVHMDWTKFNITRRQGPGSLIYVPLCELARLLPSDVPDSGLVGVLNQIVTLARAPH